jgi:cobalt-precorrin 5A hydrolase
MKTAIFCFTGDGAALALRLCQAFGLPQSAVHTTERIARGYGFTPHESVFTDMKALFDDHDALIFIGACGIAVRAIAPYVKDKATDPAVLVIDNQGSYVIPLLSGHIGGANALAKQIAERIHAAAVITTATDTASRFSCDAWAAENDCAISSMALAKEISAAILRTDIPICSEYELPDALPNGLIKKTDGELGIYIGTRIVEPYTETLRLIPRAVNVGVGCRRGTPKERILGAIKTVFEGNGLDIRAIKTIASADIKKDEAGLLEAAAVLGVETMLFTPDQLNEAQGEFSESQFVKDTVGTGCVCERAAVLAGGALTIKKTVTDGVTVALAQEQRRIEL